MYFTGDSSSLFLLSIQLTILPGIDKWYKNRDVTCQNKNLFITNKKYFYRATTNTTPSNEFKKQDHHYFNTWFFIGHCSILYWHVPAWFSCHCKRSVYVHRKSKLFFIKLFYWRLYWPGTMRPIAGQVWQKNAFVCWAGIVYPCNHWLCIYAIGWIINCPAFFAGHWWLRKHGGTKSHHQRLVPGSWKR